MKNLILFLTIAFSISSANGQYWKPFNVNEKYNYSLGSHQFYATIWVDSTTIVNTDTIFFLNKIIKRVADGEFGFEGFYLNNQSQCFLSSIYCSSNGNLTLKEDNNRKYLIKAQAILNESWIFDSINSNAATVIGISNQLILGNMDSLKIIRLTSNDTIIISKNHGIIRFPIFDSLSQGVNLIGIEGRNVGELVPKFPDFFDFNIGDVFYYKGESKSRWCNVVVLKRLIISNKKIIGDSIIYTTQYKDRSIVYGNYDSQIDTIYTNVNDSIMVYVNSSDLFLNKYNNQYLNDLSRPGRQFKPITINTDTHFGTISKEYAYNPYCLDWDSDTIMSCINPTICSNIFETFRFGEHYGLLSWEYYEYTGNPYFLWNSENLLGCVKEGISYGTIIEDNLLTPFSEINESNCKLYPNPTGGLFSVETEVLSNQAYITIFSITGHIIDRQQLKSYITLIDLTSFPSGIYLIKLDNDNTSEMKKIIKY
jgi:hypothetical protein